MRDTPQKNNTHAVIALSLLLVIVFLGMAGANIRPGIRFAFRVIAFGAFLLSVQISSRYLLTTYEYYLTPDADLAERNDFSVVRAQGKTRMPVAFLPVSDLIGVEYCPAKKTLTEKYGQIAKRINFCPTLFPSAYYVFLFRFEEQTIALSLECADAFALAALSRAPIMPDHSDL